MYSFAYWYIVTRAGSHALLQTVLCVCVCPVPSSESEPICPSAESCFDPRHVFKCVPLMQVIHRENALSIFCLYLPVCVLVCMCLCLCVWLFLSLTDKNKQKKTSFALFHHSLLSLQTLPALCVNAKYAKRQNCAWRPGCGRNAIHDHESPEDWDEASSVTVSDTIRQVYSLLLLALPECHIYRHWPGHWDPQANDFFLPRQCTGYGRLHEMHNAQTTRALFRVFNSRVVFLDDS